MAEKKPIFRFLLLKIREAGYKLLEDEKKWKKLLEDDLKNLEEVGGKHIIDCDCRWSDGEYAFSSVSEFPDIEALQKHAKFEEEHGWFRYFDYKFYLGTRYELQ